MATQGAMNIKVRYITEELDLETDGFENLLLLAIRKKLPISHSCEGMASCGTCRVIVTDGLEHLPPRNTLEQEMADDRDFRPEGRLACQMDLPQITGSFSFKLPED